MNCNHIRQFLHAYHDQELDAANALAVEEHLEQCKACRHEREDVTRLSTLIKENVHMEPAPEQLRNRINNALSESLNARKRRSVFSYPGGMALASALSLVLAIGVFLYNQHEHDEAALITEVFSGHVRALNGPTLTEIHTSDAMVLKPWFNSKLDFSPKVYNLAEYGFTLLGGRLEYVQQRQVASLAYQHNSHIINLYTWPSPDVEDAERELHSKNGYKIMYWCQEHMNYWLVSDLNGKQLKQFSDLLRQKMVN